MPRIQERTMFMPAVIACHECDLLQRETNLPPGGKACCRRCGAVLFVLANLNPVVGLEATGNRSSTTLFGTVRTLYDQDMTSVALLVFATTILMPALEIAAMLYMLLPLKLGWVPNGLPAMFRLVHTVRPWGMVEG